MTGLKQITAIAVPIEGTNIDTDRLLPARFLRKPRDENNDYRQWLFHDLRFDDRGIIIEDFALNMERFAGARIMVTDSNFGCGSSREGAVYALVDNDFRVVIAPSFGEIFSANCVRNGVAPLTVSEDVAASLRNTLHTDGSPTLTVDLRENTVTDDSGRVYQTQLDDFSRQCLIEGIDEIDYTLQQADAISAYEGRRALTHPWLFKSRQRPAGRSD